MSALELTTVEAGIVETTALIGFRDGELFELSAASTTKGPGAVIPAVATFPTGTDGMKRAAEWALGVGADKLCVGANPIRHSVDADAAPDLAVSCVRVLPLVVTTVSKSPRDFLVAQELLEEALGRSLPAIQVGSLGTPRRVLLLSHEAFLPEAARDPRRTLRNRALAALGRLVAPSGFTIELAYEALRAPIPIVGWPGVSLVEIQATAKRAVRPPILLAELDRIVGRLEPDRSSRREEREGDQARDDDDGLDDMEGPTSPSVDDATPEDLAAVRETPELAAIWDEPPPTDREARSERDVRFAVALLVAQTELMRCGRLVASLPGGLVAERKTASLVASLMSHASRIVEDRVRADMLVEALKLLETLPERVKTDPTAPFEEEVLERLRVLRGCNKAANAKLRARLRALNVSMRDLDAALGPDDETTNVPANGGNAATRILALATEAELFRSPDMVAYASVPVGDHRETWTVKSRGFRTWLARRHYTEFGSAASGQAMTDAIQVLEGQALFDGVMRRVFTRVASHEGAIYVDLVDEEWRAIKITAVGWCVVSDPPVRFRRTRGMLPLPEPVRGGNLTELFSLLNVPEGPPRTLLSGWLAGGLRPTPPYLVLVIQGEQGSGKSTASRLMKSALDPNTAVLRALPREERDLMIAARNGWVLAYDNLSGMPPWISDAFCRLSTGGALATRELYTDDDEILLEATRPCVVNGIDDLLERPDLADRAVMIHLPTIPSANRRPERELMAAFAEAHPRILGALCDAASTALRRLDDVKLAELPRMADAAQWIEAAAPALGIEQGEFVRDLEANRGESVLVALDADPVASEVRRFLGQVISPWEGTATDLQQELNRRVDDLISRDRRWPRTPQGFADRLRRLAPPLREVGIEVTFERRGHDGRRVIRIARSRPPQA